MGGSQIGVEPPPFCLACQVNLEGAYEELDHQSVIPVIIVPVSLLQAHWWAILLAILTLSAVMGGTILLCGRTLDTSDL